MNSQHPIGSQNGLRALQGILSTSSQEVDYDDDDV